MGEEKEGWERLPVQLASHFLSIPPFLSTPFYFNGKECERKSVFEAFGYTYKERISYSYLLKQIKMSQKVEVNTWNVMYATSISTANTHTHTYLKPKKKKILYFIYAHIFCGWHKFDCLLVQD